MYFLFKTANKVDDLSKEEKNEFDIFLNRTTIIPHNIYYKFRGMTLTKNQMMEIWKEYKIK